MKKEGEKKKRKFRLKYPKFLLLLITYIIAWIIFAGKDFTPISNFFSSLGYFGTFLAGVLYTYGFTSGPATVMLLILAGTGQKLIIAGLIAGIGALCGDFLIFKFIRTSFKDELHKLSREKFSQKISKHIHPVLKATILPILGGIIIGSPLPDEIGVTMMAVSKNISTRFFAVLSYLFNTAGILIILAIGALT
jgi:hypothetical protein